MRSALFIFYCHCFIISVVYSSIIPIKSEKKIGDEVYLNRQKQILDLYIGLGHTSDHNTLQSDEYNGIEDIESYSDHDLVKSFWRVYKHGGFLPKNGIFSLTAPQSLKNTIKLFDVFFFAKTFDTFYKVASWARHHFHHEQFYVAYTLAVVHREDCHDYYIPPVYEIFPSYFVPQQIIQQIQTDRIYDIKEGKYMFNTTGYEYNYHIDKYGSLSSESPEASIENKMSYIREDIGINNWYMMWYFRFPSWMNPEKYNKSNWIKRGEGFYHLHQQIFARYSLERIANELPYVERLYWDKPIKTGYNPKMSHINGMPYYVRPDNLIPEHFHNLFISLAKLYEMRIFEAIDSGHFWENDTIIRIDNEDGIDILGKTIYGSYDRPNKHYFGTYHYTAMDALSHLVTTSNDHSFIGAATSCPGTALRDPVFYNYLNRLISIFQWFKKDFKHYTEKELGFPGVNIKSIETTKLVTYFDRFDFDLTNGIPVDDFKKFNEMKFYASQHRLNHKPFTYKIIVNSDKECEGMVRIFIGPKFDSEGHLLTMEQKRLMMVEIDRIPVKLIAGENIIERASKDSPIFYNDYIGLRQMYHQISNAIENKETFTINKPYTCGTPVRTQLPRGWKAGRHYSLFTMVSPMENKFKGDDIKQFHATCGTPQLYDYRPLGFPFDRPIDDYEFHLPNIHEEDIIIYHKEEHEMNRPE